jgi:leader peptidase (prepilin peptidase)/N-methyltransferase
MDGTILILGAAVLGLFVGALANAKIMRTKDSMSFTSARACGVCAVPLHPKEMLPVVGYVAMKGRCKRCKAVVPWQYLATEIAIGVLFALFAARIVYGFELPYFITPDEYLALFIRDALMTLALVLVFMFDYRAYVIPDRVTIPGMIAAVVFNYYLGMPLELILLGGLLLGSFFALQYLLSQGRWVGGGDIRMGMLMGFLLGPLLGIVGLFISYISGAAAGVVLLAGKRRELHSHVPFGTFLAFATLVCMFFGERLLDWYMSFFS